MKHKAMSNQNIYFNAPTGNQMSYNTNAATTGSTAHSQMEGQAYYDERRFFFFAPDNPAPDAVPRFRGHGVAQQLSDGTFDFVREPTRRTQATLIRKLAHGRVSETKDRAILLTLKIYSNEGVPIAQQLRNEADEAAMAVEDWQLRR